MALQSATRDGHWYFKGLHTNEILGIPAKALNPLLHFSYGALSQCLGVSWDTICHMILFFILLFYTKLIYVCNIRYKEKKNIARCLKVFFWKFLQCTQKIGRIRYSNTLENWERIAL